MLYIKIFVGLPASGKSTLAKLEKTKVIMHMDDYSKTKPMEYHVQQFLNANSYYMNGSGSPLVVFDGLMTTNGDVVKLLNVIKANVKDIENEIVVISFEESREACLWNDYGRPIPAAASIKALPYERIDRELLCTETGMNVVRVEEIPVVRKSAIRLSEHLYHDDKFLTSEEWTMGGTWKNCWDRGGEVAVEEPVEFTQLRNLLEEVAPAISEDEYQYILHNIANVEEGCDSDYYGGSWETNWYSIDIDALERHLREKGYLTGFERKMKLKTYLDGEG
jgi:adenylate kinase family enzyme